MFFINYFSNGAPSLFLTGALFCSFGAGLTSPLIVSITGFLLEFVVNVIVLVNFPTLLVAYFTFIFSVTPGAIGSLG